MSDVINKVIKVLGSERNGWMWSFAHASNRIAAAVVADDIEPSTIETFPLGAYDEKACRAIAVAAGLTWWEDAPNSPEAKTDAEDVEIAVGAIRAIPTASIGTHDETEGSPEWMLYPEMLAEHEITVDEIRDAVRGMSLREAAALIVAADDWLRGAVHS